MLKNSEFAQNGQKAQILKKMLSCCEYKTFFIKAKLYKKIKINVSA